MSEQTNSVATPTATSATDEARTTRKLSAVQTGQLYAWLDSRRDEIGTGQTMAVEVAALASQDLKFPVSVSSVRNLCNDMAIKLKGIGDRAPRQPAFDPAPLLKEIGDLRARVDTLTEWSLKIDARIAESDKTRKGKAA